MRPMQGHESNVMISGESMNGFAGAFGCTDIALSGFFHHALELLNKESVISGGGIMRRLVGSGSRDPEDGTARLAAQAQRRLLR